MLATHDTAEAGAAEPEEAGDRCGDVRVLRNLAEVSRSDFKEKTKETRSDTSPETHYEVAPQHRNSREVFCQGTTTTIEKSVGQKLHSPNDRETPNLHKKKTLRKQKNP